MKSKFIKTQVVIIFNDEKSNLIQFNGLKTIVCLPNNQQFTSNLPFKYGHLYFLTNEEITKNEWHFYGNKFDEKELNYFKNGVDSTEFLKEQGIKKIIATTNKSILHKINPNTINLPQPSQDFINLYVSEYNKNNVISNVLVEYFDYGLYTLDGKKLKGISNFSPLIKVDDNTINANYLTYTQDQVDELLVKQIKKIFIELEISFRDLPIQENELEEFILKHIS